MSNLILTKHILLLQTKRASKPRYLLLDNKAPVDREVKHWGSSKHCIYDDIDQNHITCGSSLHDNRERLPVAFGMAEKLFLFTWLVLPVSHLPLLSQVITPGGSGTPEAIDFLKIVHVPASLRTCHRLHWHFWALFCVRCFSERRGHRSRQNTVELLGSDAR